MLNTVKRCPQCEFIYLDADENCDFDGAHLVAIDDAEIDAKTASQEPPRRFERPVTGRAREALQRQQRKRELKWLAIAAVIAATIGVVIYLAYLGITGRFSSSGSVPSNISNELVRVTPTPTPEPSPSVSPANEPTPQASAANQPAARTTPPANISRNPISTGQGSGAGAVVIRLTNGATITADEVWRNRQGIWYRRDGVVTLLNPRRVKAIERVQ